ncbi:hypothetical protein JL107_04535 [Nakamurella flavida]|uniref:Uncharacterized protein n=1 Tax=Nakamurella flavida TaxID=363630 RepID=A0A939BZG8_9ACTN|nr:hypothetical protein [Nakamurella flavida]MBM9475708.1 hypothetical protein [Nakamurella flavida]MDP9778014.1 hypothetical protein [Nakamurella flavida]
MSISDAPTRTSLITGTTDQAPGATGSHALTDRLPAGGQDVGGDLSDTPAPSRRSRRERWRALPVLRRAGSSAPMPGVARLLAASWVLLTLLAGGIGALAGLGDLRAVALTLFLTTGLAVAPVLVLSRTAVLSTSSFVLIAVAGSMAAATTVGFVMATVPVWQPVAAFWIAVAVTLVLLALSVVAEGRQWLAEVRELDLAATARTLRPGAVAAVGLVLTLVDALTHRTDPQPAGLLGSVGPLWFVGALLILAAAALAWATGGNLAVPVLALGVLAVLSQAALYGTPTVVSAARHVGVVDYIRVNGQLDPSTDIFQSWPGLFTAAAWVVDAAGISDPMILATWLPVLFAAATVLAVRVLAGRFLATPALAWAAGLLFMMANAVNTIYFAPQSIGLVYSLLILALVIARPDESARARLLRFVLVGWLTVVGVVTHQISPYLLVAALVVLVAFRLVRPWWLPIALLVPAVGWALINVNILGNFLSIEALGRLFDNLAPPVNDGLVNPPALINTIVYAVPALLLVVIGALAVLAVVRHRDRLRFGLLATAASPGTLFLATSYGQEGIFRVVMFALPWLSILAVMALPSGWLRRRVVQTGLVLSLVGITAVNVFALTGMDWARIIRADSTEAVRVFENTAPDDAVMLVTGTGRATPGRVTARYQDVRGISRDTLLNYPGLTAGYDAAADESQLTTDFLGQFPGVAHYALVSDAIGAWGDRYGMQSYEDYQELRDVMAQSPDWRAIFRGPTTTLYEYTGPGAP